MYNIFFNDIRVMFFIIIFNSTNANRFVASGN